MKCTEWQIDGSGGEEMYCTTHLPDCEPMGVLLIAHGFKGYKDYGMFPWLATQLAQLGWVVHRFNFSHSGMLGGTDEFERSDLFEIDTWNKQVEDIQILSTTLKLPDRPFILMGHSRGGVACLLAAGRKVADITGVVSLSAPATCNPLPERQQDELLTQGFIESPSSRTGQKLRIGKAFLQEQLDNPAEHDLLSLISTLELPLLIIHGEDDPTVSIHSGEALFNATSQSTIVPIGGGDHVFNTPNPFEVDEEPSAQLDQVWNAIRSWLPSK